MKRTTLLCLITALSAAPLAGQVRLNTGVSLPQDPVDFSDNRKIGPLIGIGFGFPAFTEAVTLEVHVEGSAHAVDEAAILAAANATGSGITITGGGVKMLMMSGNLVWRLGGNLSTPVRPYIRAGGGWGFTVFEDTEITSPTGASTTVLAPINMASFIWTAGAGIEFGGEGVGFFVEANYVGAGTPIGGATFNGPMKFVPIRFGVQIRPPCRGAPRSWC